MARTTVRHFSVTIPAGTPQGTPLTTPTTFEPDVVERVEWLFPHGCNGLVGIQIGARSVQVLPTTPGALFKRSGDSHGIDLQEVHVTGDWSVIGFNTGVNPHTIDVTFHTHRLEKQPAELLLIDEAELSDFPTYVPLRYG
jgi:hypothetical protein